MRTTASFLRILGFSIFGYFFLDYVGTTGDTSVFIEKPWMWILFGAIMLFYIAGEICAAALKTILYKSLSPEAKQRFDEQEAEEKKESI